MSELVVGEAVVLEMRLAKLASRSLALALDLAVQFFLLIVGTFIVLGVALQVDDALGAAMSLMFFVAVIVGYPVSFETLTRGRSLGKMALGLRVVREDGGPIRFRHALVRGLSGVVEFWLTGGAVALITSLASSKGKRVGDFLAGTVVVRERMPTQAAPIAMMPPQLAGWASTLDLARVPDDLALAARQFLGRFQDLAPEVRESMGGRLATAMAGVTAPPPPPGVPAWAFLSAVLAERRRREMARMLPPAGYQPMSPYGGHHPAAQQPPPPPPYGWQHPVAPQQFAPQPAARPADEAPEDGNPFTPPS